MPLPRRRRRRRQSTPPVNKTVANWNTGLVEYPESGLVPEDGLLDNLNRMISYDGALVDRPFSQSIEFGGSTLKPGYNLKEFTWNGHNFLLTFHPDGILVSTQEPFGDNLTASTDTDYAGWYWLCQYASDIVANAGHSAIAQGATGEGFYDDAILMGDRLVVFSRGGNHPFFYVSLNDDGHGDIITSQVIDLKPKLLRTPAPAAFAVSEETEVIEFYFLRIAYENALGQLSEASDREVLQFSQPITLSPDTDIKVRIAVGFYAADQTAKVHLFLGNVAGQEVHIKSVLAADMMTEMTQGGQTIYYTSFNGNDVRQRNFSAPTSNGTQPLNARLMKYVNGRMLAVVGKNKIYYGRTGAEDFSNLLDFSDTLGSGSLSVGAGDEEIVALTTSSGDGPRDTLVLFTAIPFDTPDSAGGTGLAEDQGYRGGKVYTATEKVIQTSEYTSFYFSLDELEGYKSTVAPLSVVSHQGAIFYLADDGFRVLGGDFPDLSHRIRQTLDSILQSPPYQIAQITGTYFEHRIYWAVPSTSGEGVYELLVLDVQQSRGAWSKWEVDANLLLPAHDPVGGNLVLMYAAAYPFFKDAGWQSRTQIYRFSPTFNANCLNHRTRVQSGRIRLSRDQAFLSFCQAIHFYFYNVAGQIDIYVYLKEEGRSDLKLVDSEDLHIETNTDVANPGMDMRPGQIPVGHLRDATIESDLVVKSMRVSVEPSDTAEWLEYVIETPKVRSGETEGIGLNRPNTYSLGSIEIKSIPIYPVIAAGDILSGEHV